MMLMQAWADNDSFSLIQNCLGTAHPEHLAALLEPISTPGFTANWPCSEQDGVVRAYALLSAVPPSEKETLTAPSSVLFYFCMESKGILDHTNQNTISLSGWCGWAAGLILGQSTHTVTGSIPC